MSFFSFWHFLRCVFLFIASGNVHTHTHTLGPQCFLCLVRCIRWIHKKHTHTHSINDRHTEQAVYRPIRIRKKLQAKHIYDSQVSVVFWRSKAAQRIFNLQIMSWFIAKNVSESWNVNWNLMLSRLNANSPTLYTLYISLHDSCRCSFLWLC